MSQKSELITVGEVRNRYRLTHLMGYKEGNYCYLFGIITGSNIIVKDGVGWDGGNFSN